MDLVFMGVPRHLVQPVADLIAADSSAGASPNGGTLLNGWTNKTVRRAYRDSKENMRNLLEHLATNPGQEFGTVELAQAIGVRDWNSIAGMLGPFTRRCRDRYGKDDPPWAQRTDTNNRDHLKMPAEIASIIREEAQS